MAAEVLLLDTFSLFFRAFYALPAMSTRSGEPTSALYGLSVLLLKLLRERRGAELVFALDAPVATFRHEAYDGYKAGRSSPPAPLLAQLDRLPELLEVLGAPAYRVPGFEADDVLATLARELRDAGRPALVVSGDRDLLQVARGSIGVYFVGARAKDAVVYDEAAVQARFGVAPALLPSYVALVGDPSDNLPRVAGIGPKTAQQLLTGMRDCTELLANLDRVGSERLRQVLAHHREQILRTETLAHLREDVELPGGARHAAPNHEDLHRTRKLFKEIEFQSLLPSLDALLVK